MRPAALKIISVSWAENASLIVDGNFKASAQNDASLFPFVNKWNLTRVCARLIALRQNLQTASKEIFSNLAIGDLALSNLYQLLGRIKSLLWFSRLEGEKLREADRNAVQYPLQRAHRGVG